MQVGVVAPAARRGGARAVSLMRTRSLGRPSTRAVFRSGSWAISGVLALAATAAATGLALAEGAGRANVPTPFAKRQTLTEASDWELRNIPAQYRRRFEPVEPEAPGSRWTERAPSSPRQDTATPPTQNVQAESGAPLPIEPDYSRLEQPGAVASPTPAAATPAPAPSPAPSPRCDIPTCEARYFSFRSSDCTYQPNFGGRRLCTRGDPDSAASVAAWLRRNQSQTAAATPATSPALDTPEDAAGEGEEAEATAAAPLQIPAPRRVPLSPAAARAQAERLAGSTPRCDIPTCEARYRSFQAGDCTYQPNNGPRRLCTRGDPNSAASVAAWRRNALASAGVKPAEAAPEPTPASVSSAATAGLQPQCDIPTCGSRYRSFNVADCTYQPNFGGRRLCTRGDPNSASSLAAWSKRLTVMANAETTDRQAAAQAAAARAELARVGAASAAARAEAAKLAPQRASASVSADGAALLNWVDLFALAAFAGFCVHAFVRLWSAPMRAEG